MLCDCGWNWPEGQTGISAALCREFPVSPAFPSAEFQRFPRFPLRSLAPWRETCLRSVLHRQHDRLAKGLQRFLQSVDPRVVARVQHATNVLLAAADRKSTRLNSSHLGISYAVFCLKK